ncbi:RNA-directed DNA polymerase, eukaryota, reverse transcriptase zinc-binding domain protein [Tanacetum coccineum]
MDQGNSSEEDLIQRRDSCKILSDIDRLEAKDIAQKAKVKWTLEGDENTKFFHGMLKKKRRQLAIRGVFKNGDWIEDPHCVKEEFYSHYSNRFNLADGLMPSLDGVMPNILSSGHRDYLERQFSNDEIKRAVWDCGGDRAPGPDGYTFKFFTTFWDVIEADVIRFVQDFFRTGKFPKGCNSTFIAWIPKVSNAKFVMDFRPISLIGCQYKIVGKILANQLSKVIRNCISPEQLAFIKGRNILDGPLILNEVMAWYRKRKKDLMVFKVDFEKAFDSLRWDYLDLIMVNLVNGSPTREFKIFRGLRQGDPLSPFLFILAMEGLHVLSCKEEPIGLKINVNKCGILGVGKTDEEVSNLAHLLGCGEVVIQKFRSKLSLWKARLLSVRGRLSLIKSVLSSLPIYYMSIYMMPVTVQKKLESMRNNFFIGGDMDDRKMTWIWRFLCNSSDLWVRVIKSIYGDQGGIIEGSSLNQRHTTWGAILSAVRSLNQKGVDLLAMCVRKVGNGKTCRFWEDIWVVMTQGIVLSDKSDTWDWSLNVSSGFSVASVRTLVDSHILDASPVATRWNRSIPIKINVFLWRLSLNKLATRVNLDRKGIDVDSTLCPLCMEDVETVNHIFFSCNMAMVLWGLFASWWELDIPVCANVEDWFGWIDSLHRSNRIKSIIEGAGSTLLWCIWKFRNELIFSSQPPKKSTLWDSILSLSFLWISSRNPKCNFR